MKKFLSLFLASFTLFSFLLGTTITAAESSFSNFKVVRTYTSKTFEDVQSSSWYYESVKTAYELGLMNGSGATKFSPSNSITVAETLALACRIHSIYTNDGHIFQQGNPWYQCYIDYANDHDIVMPKVANYTSSASREDFAYILSSALPQSAFQQINSINKLPDVSSSSYAYDSILMLYRSGIITGNDKYGTFAPNSSIVRSEVSAIITRIADPSLRKTFILEEMPNITVKEVGCSTDIQYTITDYRFDVFKNILGDWKYYALVEIENTGKTPIYMKNCIFDLEDPEGHLLQSDDFISDVPGWIAPGEKGYFYNFSGTTIQKEFPSEAELQLVAQITLVRAKNSAIRYDIFDTDISFSDESSFDITGRIKNHTNSDVDYLYIDCILLDKNGRALGIFGTSVTDLYANSTQSFQISNYLSSRQIDPDDISTYKLIAQEMYYQWD